MANPTTNFGWVMPTSTDLVTDLPADFAVFGQAVDTSMADLKGGTTGQILAKATNTDMDFTWTTPNPGDITGVTAGTGISGGGTSGDVTITNSMATTITTSGDLIYGTGSGTFTRRGIGSTGNVLTVSGGVPVWSAPAGGGKVLQVVQGTYSTELSSSSTTYVTTGLTVSITPTSATSKIYVHAIINGLTKSSGSANNASNIRLLRNAATTIITSTGINYTGVDGTNQGQGVIQYLDSPATTSATTYDVYFANRFASGTVYAQDGGSTNQSIITVWEIGA